MPPRSYTGMAHHHEEKSDPGRRNFVCPMTKEVTRIGTGSVVFTVIVPGLIEQRHLPDASLDERTMERCRATRRKLAKGVPFALLIIVPEEVPVDAAATNHDHYRKESDERSIVALAVVTSSEAMSAVTKFYFRYYQCSFEVKVFDDEDNAKAWLLASLERLAQG